MINRGCLKSSIFLLILSFVCNSAFAEHTLDEWQKRKSAHFIIYYKEEPHPGYVGEVVVAAESYYKTITENFGFRRFNFWTWQNRCKIFLYLSEGKYYNKTKQPHWSTGTVSIKKREISTRIHGEDFIDSVLPHEMGHLIFREFVGYKRELPLWLDEGIACLNERKYKLERLEIAKRLVKLNSYIPLQNLTRMNDIRTIIIPNFFYSEAASVVNFLLTEFGKDRFLEFSRAIRDGLNWKEAIKKTYGFEDMLEMNNEWVSFLNR